MKPETINALLAINRGLYEDHAAEFSATRQKPWRGWDRLAAALPAAAAERRLSVLDAGCGNGRFGVFLSSKRSIDYTGVDYSAPLLDAARAQLPSGRFVEADLISWTADREYDLAVAMGVLHHIPTMELRRRFLAELARAAKRVCFTFWSFDPSKAIETPAGDLDPGDYVLRFGAKSLRYCHLASTPEREDLIQSTGMTLQDRWNDDDANDYVLLVR